MKTQKQNTKSIWLMFHISTLKRGIHLKLQCNCLGGLFGRVGICWSWGIFPRWLWHTSATLTLNEGSHSLVSPPQYSWGSRGREEEARETRTRAVLDGDRPNWGQTMNWQTIIVLEQRGQVQINLLEEGAGVKVCCWASIDPLVSFKFPLSAMHTDSYTWQLHYTSWDPKTTQNNSLN